METSLGKSSVKRVLTTLEAGTYTAAATSVLTLVSLTGGLTVTGAGASTYSVG